MAVFTGSFPRRTEGFTDVLDISSEVEKIVRQSSVQSGILTVSVAGSTASVTTLEFEPGAIADLRDAIERLAPANIPYAHDEKWGDGNGFAHVRAALLGPSVALPVNNGEIHLGSWQQIVLVDFDNRPRNRTILVQIVGE